jgi:hypothetical protein
LRPTATHDGMSKSRKFLCHRAAQSTRYAGYHDYMLPVH